MSRSMMWVMAMHALRVLLAIAGLMVCLDCLAGCAPRQTQPQLPAYCYSEPALIAAHLRCTDKSATRAESEACGVELDRSCGFEVKP